MMRLLPTGVLGLVFAALVAAIIASTASKINSIATIFTLDLYAKRTDTTETNAADERKLVLIGRVAAGVAIVLAMATARPLLGNSEQAFQYIQDYTGFCHAGHHCHLPAWLVLEKGERAGRDRGGGGVVRAVAGGQISGAGLPLYEPDAGRVHRDAGARAVIVSLLLTSEGRTEPHRHARRGFLDVARVQCRGGRRGRDPHRLVRHLVVR